MGQYITRRLLAGAIDLLIVSLIVAGMLRFIPSDAAAIVAGEQSSNPAVIAAIRHELGLDEPFPKQYAEWMGGIVRGDFGRSFMTSESTSRRVVHALPATIELAVLATVISILIGFPVGIVAGLWRGSSIDFFSRLFAVGGISIPSFWLATLLLVFPALWFGWTPPLQYRSLAVDLRANVELLFGPALILGWAFSAAIARLLRSSTLEVLGRDYVRTARAKGLRQRAVVLRHAVPNALLPVVSVVGTEIAVLLGGVVVIERIFNIPGLGRLTYDAILARDYPQVQTNAMFFSAVLILMNLLTDMSYGWIDPRVRQR